MKKTVLFLIMLTISLTASSCYNDILPAVPLPANVTFQKDVQSIFNKNCIGCHKTGATVPDLTTANSYLSLTTLTDGEKFVISKDANASILFQAMTGKGAPLMPPNGSLSASKLALVEKWINDGGLNN